MPLEHTCSVMHCHFYKEKKKDSCVKYKRKKNRLNVKKIIYKLVIPEK